MIQLLDQIVASPLRPSGFLSSALSYSDPDDVEICQTMDHQIRHKRRRSRGGGRRGCIVGQRNENEKPGD